MAAQPPTRSRRILRVLPIGRVLALSTLAAALALLGFAITTHWPLLFAAGFVAGLAGGADGPLDWTRQFGTDGHVLADAVAIDDLAPRSWWCSPASTLR